MPRTSNFPLALNLPTDINKSSAVSADFSQNRFKLGPGKFVRGQFDRILRDHFQWKSIGFSIFRHTFQNLNLSKWQLRRARGREMRFHLAECFCVLATAIACGSAGAVLASDIEARAKCVKSPTEQCVIALAIASAEKISDPALRAEAQARAGDIHSALISARNVSEKFDRDQAFATVVAAQAVRGDSAGAEIAAKEIDGPYFSMVARHYIGGALAKSGDIAGAWKAVETIEDIRRDDMTGSVDSRDMEIFRADTISAIVKAHIAAGALESALAAAAEMTDEFAYIDAHVAIATAQTAAGDLDAALASAEPACEDYYYYDRCVEVLAGLGAAHAEAGRPILAREALSAAKKFAESAEFELERSNAFSALYSAWLQIGDSDEAAHALSAALSAADATDEAVERAARLLEIGIAAAQAGDVGGGALAFGRAKAAAGEIEYGEERVDYFIRAGLARNQAGDAVGARDEFSRALDSALNIEDGSWRAEAIANIAIALASG